MSIAIANVATAQTKTPQKDQSKPQVAAPSLTQSDIKKLIKDEIENQEPKNQIKIRDRVQNEVDRSFGSTMVLIQFQLVVITVIPILAVILLFVLRHSIKNQLVEEAKNQVKEKLALEIEEIKKTANEKLDLVIREAIDKLNSEFDRRMEQLLAEVIKKKDSVTEELGRLVPEPSIKEDNRELTNPDVLAKIQELTIQLQKIHENYPELKLTAEDYVIKGKSLFYEASYEEALAAYNKAIELDSNYPDAWNGKGNTLRKLQLYEEALTAFKKAIELNPNNLKAWLGMGSTLGELRRNIESLIAFDKAIELDSNNPDAWNGRGATLIQLNRHAESLHALETAISLNPDHVLAWINKGSSLGGLKKYKESLIAYEKAIELNSKDFNAWFGIGLVLTYLKRNEEALVSFGKASELNPNHPNSWYHIACLYSLTGNAKLAIQNLKQSIKLNATYREKAKTKSDFDNIREDPDFNRLIADNVIIVEHRQTASNLNDYPLAGKVIQYDEPFEPATDIQDWDVLK